MALVAHPPAHESWQVQVLTPANPAIGLGLLSGSLSLLLTFVWLRIQHLTRAIYRRDQALESLSVADPLTGLANRKKLCQIGAQRLANPDSQPISLLYLGIDRFKSINNTLGAQAGDEILSQVGHRLQGCLCASDMLARVGGDEFAILLHTHEPAQIDGVIKRALTAISQPFRLTGTTVTLSASLGVAIAALPPSQNQNFSQLLTQADLAMSQAKRAQSSSCQAFCAIAAAKQQPALWSERVASLISSVLSKAQPAYGCYAHSSDIHSDTYSQTHSCYSASHYAFFHPDMQTEAVSMGKLRQDLKAASVQQELRLCYQPIVDLNNSQTIGFEALVRWQHPERGLLLPNDFLPLAEAMGSSAPIDRWVLQQVCQQLVVWQAFRLSPSVSVNLSATHLAQLDLVKYIQNLLACYPIDPQQLNLEVTESILIADLDQAVKTLGQIKRLGVSVSLDDFGTGYSALSYLSRLPVDVLKIDRAFVSGLKGHAKENPKEDLKEDLKENSLASHHKNAVIIQSILDLATRLNIRVVAEGIEQADQLCALQQMGCRYGQGNFFSAPVEGAVAYQQLAKNG
jgi:diguanylate cyclase